METVKKAKTEAGSEGYIIVPREWLSKISETLETILTRLGNQDSAPSLGEFISEAEAKALLGRKTTWFWNMRTCGQLPYSKVGNKVYYLRADITRLLEQNRHGKTRELPLSIAA